MLVSSMITDRQVRNFFNQYASRMNNALFNDPIDLEGIAQSFAENFVGANPNGIQAGQNDEQFKNAIREGIAFYRNIGIRSMIILDQEVETLDGLHALTKILWKCVYDSRSASGEMMFVNYYMVQCRSNDTIKIFSYVTGDEVNAFREHRLL